MSDYLCVTAAIPPTSPEMVNRIRQLEERVREAPQSEFVTEHVFHSGMYARTIRIGPNVVFTSVLVKRTTLLIVQGEVFVLAGDDWVRMSGYNVLPAEAGRKQIYVTGSEVVITMVFPSDAKTVEEAEAEFTDEYDNLLSHSNENDIVMTEVTACLESQPLPHS